MIPLVVTAAAQTAALVVAVAAVLLAVTRWDRMLDARQELADRLARRPRAPHWR